MALRFSGATLVPQTPHRLNRRTNRSDRATAFHLQPAIISLLSWLHRISFKNGLFDDKLDETDISQHSSFTLILTDPPVQPEFDDFSAKDVLPTQYCTPTELNSLRRSVGTPGEWMTVIRTAFYHSVS